MNRKLCTILVMLCSLQTIHLQADMLEQQFRSEHPSRYHSPVPDFPRQSAPLNEEQKALRQKLLDQALIDFEGEAYEAQVMEYIEMILNDGILHDPQGYLDAWRKARGITREYRMPEDPARYFFYRNLHPEKIGYNL